MTHLLDTDHLSILQRPGGTDYAILVMNLSNHLDTEIGVSVVSLHEQTLGCHALINGARTTADVLIGYDLLARTIEDFRRFPLVPYDAAAGVIFDQLKTSKLRVGTMDLRIAAIAIARSLILVTRNAQDYSQIPGLRIEDWTR